MDDQAAQVNVSLRISIFRVSALQGIPWWANWGWIFNLQTQAVMLLAFCPFVLLQSKSAKATADLHIQTIKNIQYS